jgi:zinc/manganese transport system ATP-binding protein
VTHAVELEDAAVAIGGRSIWQHVSLTVGPGSFVAVLGSNGAG